MLSVCASMCMCESYSPARALLPSSTNSNYTFVSGTIHEELKDQLTEKFVVSNLAKI